MAKDSITSRLKVEDGNDLQVGAPMKGEVLDIKVAAGDVVEKGQGIDLFCYECIQELNHVTSL